MVQIFVVLNLANNFLVLVSKKQRSCSEPQACQLLRLDFGLSVISQKKKIVIVLFFYAISLNECFCTRVFLRKQKRRKFLSVNDIVASWKNKIKYFAKSICNPLSIEY